MTEEKEVKRAPQEVSIRRGKWLEVTRGEHTAIYNLDLVESIFAMRGSGTQPLTMANPELTEATRLLLVSGDEVILEQTLAQTIRLLGL